MLFLFSYFLVVLVVSVPLYSSKRQRDVLEASCEIAGMDNEDARALIQLVYDNVVEELPKIEKTWSDDEPDGKALSQSYATLLDLTIEPVEKAFIYYAHHKNKKRFKELHKKTWWSLSSSYNDYALIRIESPEKVVGKVEARDKFSRKELSQGMLHVLVKAPHYRLRHTMLFPGKPELMISRIMFVWAHELGHMLNDYRNDTLFKCIIRALPVMLPIAIGVSIAPSLVKQKFPLWTENNPGIFVGGVLMTWAATVLSLPMMLVRADGTQAEYNADATALMLMPKSQQQGSIVCLTEFICNEHHEYVQHVAPHGLAYRFLFAAKEGLKRLISPQHDIHPRPQKRLLRVSNIIIKNTPSGRRAQQVVALEQTADDTVENYVSHFAQSKELVLAQEAQEAAARTRHDLYHIFTKLRRCYNVPKKVCVS